MVFEETTPCEDRAAADAPGGACQVTPRIIRSGPTDRDPGATHPRFPNTVGPAP